MREGRSVRRAFWCGVPLLALVAGCSLGNPSLVFPSDTGVNNPSDGSTDTGRDVAVDVPTDAAVDVPVDVPVDVSVDVPDVVSVDVPDAGFDVPDVPGDVGFDVPDVPGDVGFDVPDVPVDVGFDVPDVPVDVGVDVPDVPVDVGVDVPDVPVDMPPICPAGQTLCGTTCVNTITDVNHCGGCGVVCSVPSGTAACVSGACAVASCLGTTADCDGNVANGCETNTNTDNDNCNRCGRVCPMDQMCNDGNCLAGRSCAELHTRRPTLPSGPYVVDLDHYGPNVPVFANCDMATDGGGWTLVFDSANTNINQTDANWTRTDVALALVNSNTATEALLVHRDASFAPLAGVTTARFNIPTAWRTSSPLAIDRRDDTVMVSLNNAAAVSRSLRYGYRSFADNCGGAWDDGSNFGRVCIQDTTAPFFARFGNGGFDTCPTSDLSWNGNISTNACSSVRRFTIYVR